MSSLNRLLRVAMGTALVLGAGASPGAAQTADAPAGLPAKIAAMSRNFEVAPDGSWTMTAHNETQILQQSAIGSLAEPALAYSDQMQQMEVTEAYTRKADGRMLQVTPDAILTQQSPAARGSPMLTDLKQKVILYPNVEVGDVLVYTSVTHSRPMVEGNFFLSVLFPASVPIDDGHLTVSLPKSMAASFDVRDMDAQKTEQGDRVLYSIAYANRSPVPRGMQAVSEFDRAARFSISTFKDYDALAKAYAALALPAMAVTPEISAQADAITQNVSDRREQARRIYEWVAGHVRYTAVEFGEGAIVPHTAANVLRNAYGDCKDHAVLFAALLKAKGIDSNMVLINGTDSYTISDTPGISPFNHVITWLPEFGLYADSTSHGTAFGLLPRSEYGKQVVHIGDRRGALHQVPLADPRISTDSYRLTIRMDDDGRIESESSSTGTGDFAAQMRLLGAMIQGDNGKRLAVSLLEKSRMPHATGALMAPPPDPNDPQYRISATYAPAEALSPLVAGTPFTLGDNLQLMKPISALLFGPVLDERYKAADTVPCYGGQSSDDETMEFPASRHLAKMPDDTSIRTEHLSYVSRWSKTATSVSVHREFSAKFDKPVCSGAVREEVRSAFAKIQADIAGATVAVARN